MENDANEIIPRLWQGAAPPSPESVLEDGFTALFLCARGMPFESETFPGVLTVRAPFNDTENPSEKERSVAVKAAQHVKLLHDQGHNVLVTCQAGINRSGLVVALALHLIKGWKGEFCIEVIRQKRIPFGLTWDPYCPQPLCNSAFREIVLKTCPEGTSRQ